MAFTVFTTLNILLKCERIAEQKLWIWHAKSVRSGQRVRRDVDRHDAAVHDDVIGRDVATNEKGFLRFYA